MAPFLSVSRSRESRSARRRKLINARSEFGGSHSCSVRAASPTRPTRATRLISTPPAHSKQRTHSTCEQTAQPGRCRAINVQFDEVNDGYSAGRDGPPIVLGPAPGPRSMLPSRLCGSLPADPSLTPTGPHEPPSGQPRSPCFTLRPGANRLLLAPTDQMACHSCAIASTGDRARPVTTGVEPTELKLRDLLLSQSGPRVQPLQGRG
jgi:hypothetical protein